MAKKKNLGTRLRANYYILQMLQGLERHQKNIGIARLGICGPLFQGKSPMPLRTSYTNIAIYEPRTTVLAYSLQVPPKTPYTSLYRTRTNLTLVRSSYKANSYIEPIILHFAHSCHLYRLDSSPDNNPENFYTPKHRPQLSLTIRLVPKMRAPFWL